ncbi:CPXV004 protein [Cowpox virus]|nr:CPXV004 protein [Cowpox virus]
MIAVLDDSISLPYNKLEYIFYFYEKLIIVFIYGLKTYYKKWVGYWELELVISLCVSHLPGIWLSTSRTLPT